MITFLLIWLAIGLVTAIVALIHDYFHQGYLDVEDLRGGFVLTVFGILSPFVLISVLASANKHKKIITRNKK